MTREKKTALKAVTLEDAQAASLLYSQTDKKLTVIETKINEQCDNIKEKYQEEINELTETRTEQVDILHAYGESEKAAWGEKKSYEFLHTIIGFRKGTPAVGKLKGVTWEAVLAFLKKNSTLKTLFVRTVEAIDKKAILAMKDEKTLKLLESKASVIIEQEETFYVSPKEEKLQTA